MLARRVLLRNHPGLRLGVRLRYGNLERRQLAFRVRDQRRQRIVSDDLRIVELRYFFVLATLENVAQHPQGMVRLAVERVTLGDRDQPGSRRAFVALHVIVVADAVVTFGNDLLHVPQALLGLGCQRILGILLEESLKLLLGGLGFGAVAIGLGDLLVMGVRPLELRIACFRQEGKEDAEVFISLDGLGQVRGPAFFIVGVGDRQFCLGQVLAIRIGIDERLQTEASHFLTYVLDVVDGAGVQNLVGFGSVGGAGGLVYFFLFVEDLRVAGVDRQRRQSPDQNKYAY